MVEGKRRRLSPKASLGHRYTWWRDFMCEAGRCGRRAIYGRCSSRLSKSAAWGSQTKLPPDPPTDVPLQFVLLKEEVDAVGHDASFSEGQVGEVFTVGRLISEASPARYLFGFL